MVSIKKTGIVYTDGNLNHIAFPMGGIGAGMICIEGNGSFSNISIRHKPELQQHSYFFASFAVKGKIPRILEGQTPEWKISTLPESGRGLGSTNFGLPKCKTTSFTAKFPFVIIKIKHPELPIDISVCGWSPFIPTDPDNSSLPVCAIEYTLTNRSSRQIKGVFGFHSKNFLADRIQTAKTVILEDGFVLTSEQSKNQKFSESALAVELLKMKTSVTQWCGTGGFSDTHQILWHDICSTRLITTNENQIFSPGASVFTKISLPPKQKKTIRILVSWYIPSSNIKIGESPSDFYQPWYASRFQNILDVSKYWKKNYLELKKKSKLFSEVFFCSDIHPEIIEAISANLSIFKSPTMLRQKDGRLWCWEGCCDNTGCCFGSCTHVWNYCQAISHLFPSLERTLRQTEFDENQNEEGHQNFRALLPIRPNTHTFHAAADGQLGGIMKVYREWRISGDDEWLKKLWPKVKKSIDYCIKIWDPEHNGFLKLPHHNTYDIEFWGPDGMCCSFYAGALKAVSLMAEYLNENTTFYLSLYNKARKYLENNLFNGEYFQQKIMWNYAEAPEKFDDRSLKEKYKADRIVEIIKKEGPPYQYGSGCLADGVLGTWIAEMCGLGEILDKRKIQKHLLSVYKYNFKKNLLNHANCQRPGYALGNEGGLILCTWPKGNKPTLPFFYSDEVWTGIEYQVASHLIMNGFVEEGIEVVKTARKRYDGTKRNPFDEYECGHWYGRALSCYGLIQSITGLRYDSIKKTLYLKQWKKKNASVFFSTENGWGMAGFKNGKPFVKVLYGNVTVKKIVIMK